MSSRSYLSIGDVLTLLRQEFPDVTISKIRFLESQGLVNPERTPSGYRKFYEHDVERLRWVLRQQRENFLPLKVIKDRLDEDADPSAPGHDTAQAAPAPARAGEVRSGSAAGTHHADEPVLVGHRTSAAGHSRGAGEAEPAVDTSTSLVADGPTLPGIEPIPHAAATPGVPNLTTVGGAALSSSGSSASGTAPAAPAPAPGHSSARDVAAGATAKRKSPSKPGAAKTEQATAPTARAGGNEASATPPTPTPAAPTASTAPAITQPVSPGAPVAAPTPPAGESPGAPATSGAGTSAVELNGASLSVEDLSTACGLSVDTLRELQEYGLLTANTVAGQQFFDEEAMAVANVAARFARFGIEPRHLRLYKNAADREAGFVEQIVIPLVRQRNPDARARAHETADELARLGQELRGSLLRTALGDLLNG
ncbi:MAG TPA: MerR family transcriptional regulator [Acidimicrobiales bacterium]